MSSYYQMILHFIGVNLFKNIEALDHVRFPLMPSKYLFFAFNSALEGAPCSMSLLPVLAERAHPTSSWSLGRLLFNSPGGTRLSRTRRAHSLHRGRSVSCGSVFISKSLKYIPQVTSKVPPLRIGGKKKYSWVTESYLGCIGALENH